MAVDRFTRFKILRALWARARSLMAWLNGPQDRDARLRATRWQQIQVAERQLRDGIVRGTGDPDSALRPPPAAQQETQRQAQQDAQRRWDDAQRAWVAHHRAQHQHHRRR